MVAVRWAKLAAPQGTKQARVWKSVRLEVAVHRLVEKRPRAAAVQDAERLPVTHKPHEASWRLRNAGGVIRLEAGIPLCYFPFSKQLNQRNTMPQAIMDPGEVRRFAEELKRFNIETQNRMSLLQARFAALGDTWADQEHTKFSEEFRDTMKTLKKFIESSNQHTPFLLRKAQRIEEYLDQH